MLLGQPSLSLSCPLAEAPSSAQSLLASQLEFSAELLTLIHASPRLLPEPPMLIALVTESSLLKFRRGMKAFR